MENSSEYLSKLYEERSQVLDDLMSKESVAESYRQTGAQVPVALLASIKHKKSMLERIDKQIDYVFQNSGTKKKR